MARCRRPQNLEDIYIYRVFFAVCVCFSPPLQNTPPAGTDGKKKDQPSLFDLIHTEKLSIDVMYDCLKP